MMNGVSLFSSAGIGEYFLKDININIVLSNELIKRRSDLHKVIYPETEVLCGDIQSKDVKEHINQTIKEKNVKFLMATPPCQGFSLVGKNKTMTQMQSDPRNYLFLDVVEIIKANNLDFILIENVPRFLKLFLPYNGEPKGVIDILHDELGDKYHIKVDIFDSSDFGVPQVRKRAIIRIFKKNLKWEDPEPISKKISVRESIGHLPSLESEEKSDIRWHYGRKHSAEHILCMRHTPEGKSAFQNKIHFPKSKNGSIPKGFKTTYARIKWDEPCPTITMRNDAISSQTNVHPGRQLTDGTYSDARVLSIKELFLLTGLGNNFDLPLETSEILIRQVIGECVPPLLIKNICQKIS